MKPEATLEAVGEGAMRNLKPGDIIQMVRVGFGRVGSVSPEMFAKTTEGCIRVPAMVFVYFAHR